MKEILCFGDSNTYGLIPGTTRRYDRETRWTGILAEKLYDRGYRIIEEGLCGRTSVFDDATRDGRNGAKVLPMLLETHAPLDQVVLMLGTNDCKTYNHASADRIGKGIEKLIPSDGSNKRITIIRRRCRRYIKERIITDRYGNYTEYSRS